MPPLTPSPFLLFTTLLIILPLTHPQPLPRTYTQQPPLNYQPRSTYYQMRVSPNQNNVVFFGYWDVGFIFMRSMYHPQAYQEVKMFDYNDPVRQRIATIEFSESGLDLYVVTSVLADDNSNITFYMYGFDIKDGVIDQNYQYMGTFPVFKNDYCAALLRPINSERFAMTCADIFIDIYSFGRGTDSPGLINTKYNMTKVCDGYNTIAWDMDYTQYGNNHYLAYIAGAGNCFMIFSSRDRNITVFDTHSNSGTATLLDGELVINSAWIDNITFINRRVDQSLSQVTYFKDYYIQSRTFPKNASFFTAFQSNDQQTKVRVYQVTKQQQNSSTIINPNPNNDKPLSLSELSTFNPQNPTFNPTPNPTLTPTTPPPTTTPTYTLTITLNRTFPSYTRLLTTTHLANDILLLNRSISTSTLVHRWSLCLDGNYQQNNTCLPCDSPCKTCHKSAGQCTTCIEGMVYKYESCGPCGEQYPGCKECNTTDCLRCDDSKGFIAKVLNNKCTCEYGTFPANKGHECQQCSSLMPGCLSCFRNNSCQNCNTLANFTYNTTTRTCQCQANYSLKANTTCELCSSAISNCIECQWTTDGDETCSTCIHGYYPSVDNTTCVDCLRVSEGCIQCTTQGKCLKCDATRNYNTTVTSDGKCVCRFGFVEENGTCLPCKASGCKQCSDQEHCVGCYVEKRFKEKPVDGECACQGNTLPNDDKSECFECGEKMVGCVECTSLSRCTGCDAESHFRLNVSSSLCICEQNHFIPTNRSSMITPSTPPSCIPCQSLIPYCTTCSPSTPNIVCQTCHPGFTYLPSTNTCQCPDGYQILQQKCQKKSYMLQFIIGGGILIVVVGVAVGCVIRKRRVRRQKVLENEGGNGYNSGEYFGYHQEDGRKKSLLEGSVGSQATRR